MDFDWTISLSAIIQLTAFLAGGIGIVLHMQSSLKLLSAEVAHVKETLAPLVPILTMVARQEERLDNHAHRLTRLEDSA